MGLEWRVGVEGVDIEDNIERVQGMDLGLIGFIQGILMLVNGVTDKVMVLVFRLVLMGVAMLGNSNLGLNMALATTISGLKINSWVFFLPFRMVKFE